MALKIAYKSELNQSISVYKYRCLAGINVSKLAEMCINPQTRKTTVMGVKDAQMALKVFGGRKIDIK